jgi:hypothetical protein
MRFYTIALLAGATAAAAGNTATLLLPGFEGQELQARIVETVRTRSLCDQRALSTKKLETNYPQNGDATTYKVTCPKTVAADECGIVGDGLTAIAAPTSAQLQNINLQGT